MTPLSSPTASTNCTFSIEGCALGRLEDLHLQGIEGNEDQLLQFLRGSPGLKRLSFLRCYFDSGSWTSFYEALRLFNKLETFCIEYPHGAAETCGKPGEEWSPYVLTTSRRRYKHLQMNTLTSY